jgi:hypothetical protein
MRDHIGGGLAVVKGGVPGTFVSWMLRLIIILVIILNTTQSSHTMNTRHDTHK